MDGLLTATSGHLHVTGDFLHVDLTYLDVLIFSFHSPGRDKLRFGDCWPSNCSERIKNQLQITTGPTQRRWGAAEPFCVRGARLADVGPEAAPGRLEPPFGSPQGAPVPHPQELAPDQVWLPRAQTLPNKGGTQRLHRKLEPQDGVGGGFLSSRYKCRHWHHLAGAEEAPGGTGARGVPWVPVLSVPEPLMSRGWTGHEKGPRVEAQPPRCCLLLRGAVGAWGSQGFCALFEGPQPTGVGKGTSKKCR